jgi:hypothetical protein
MALGSVKVLERGVAVLAAKTRLAPKERVTAGRTPVGRRVLGRLAESGRVSAVRDWSGPPAG